MAVLKETVLGTAGRAVAGVAVLALLAACGGTSNVAPVVGPKATGGSAEASPPGAGAAGAGSTAGAGGSGIAGFVLPRSGPAATPEAAALRGLTAAQIAAEAETNVDQLTSVRKKEVISGSQYYAGSPVTYASFAWDVHITPVGCAGTLTATPAAGSGGAAPAQVVEGVLVGDDEWAKPDSAAIPQWTPDLPANQAGKWVKRTLDSPMSPLDADVCSPGNDAAKPSTGTLGTLTAGPAVTIDGQSCLTFRGADSGGVIAVSDTDHPYIVAVQAQESAGSSSAAGAGPTAAGGAAGEAIHLSVVLSEFEKPYPIAAPPAAEVYTG